jgi:serine/threonine-protein kinase
MGKEVDARADVYALGCSLYHMCSGHPPFRKGGQDDHYTAVVRRHLKSERPELKLEIKGFDEALSDLCRRMMSRRPDVRPTFEELKTSLSEISRRLGGEVPPRHASVELRSPEEITEAAKKVGSKQTELVPGDNSPARNTRTTMIAVGIGVSIGIGLGVVLAIMSM